jgi:hypothetical protein
MEHASSPDGYVQSKVSAVAARLLKRGWLVYCLLYLSAFYLSLIGFWVGCVIVHGFPSHVHCVNCDFAGWSSIWLLQIF